MMSREIKFRAWDAIKKEMVQMPIIQKVVAPRVYYYASVPSRQAEPKLMQYTGLKDKSGVEIYEGDILELKPYAPMEVKFGDGAFFVTPNPYWDVKISSEYLRKAGLEVIGNIYQNPELIEG